MNVGNLLSRRSIVGICVQVFIILTFYITSFAEVIVSDKSASATSAMALSSSAGDSAQGNGSATALPDLFSGTFNYSIPIAVPPGRHGMQPTINLNYRSSNGNGQLGVGWQLEMGAIERSTGKGVNFSGTEFVFHTADYRVDLASVNGEYRFKIENDFIRIRELIASDGKPYWEATGKDGKRFLFGQTVSSRQDNPADAGQIFKWCLDRVEDTNGNFMTVSYFKDQGEIYLDRIDYSGNSSLAPINYVKFYRDNGQRSDVPEMYAYNFKVKTAYRLNTIDIMANNNRFKSYKLEYDVDPLTIGSQNSNNTRRSLLTRVQVFGKDAILDANGSITSGTSLNISNLSYKDDLAGTFTASAQTFNSWCSANDPNAKFLTGDFNGDGKADLLCLWGNAPNSHTAIALSNGDGSFSSQTPNLPGWCSANDPNAQIKLGDFNGDGKTDLLCFWGNAPNSHTAIALSNGDGTFSTPPATLPGWCSANDPNAKFITGDFNGDGKTDVLCFWGNAPNSNIAIAVSNGDGIFTPSSTVLAGWCSANDPNAKLVIGDFNGDGKTDLLCLSGNAPNSNSAIALSNYNGSFTAMPPTLTGWCSANDPNAKLVVGDFNADGKVDVACLSGNAPNSNTSIALSNGNGSFAALPPTLQGWCSVNDPNAKFGVSDFNGDGKTDLVCLSGNAPNSNTSIALSNGNGSFTALPPTLPGWCSANDPNGKFSVGDFNGDGKTDLLCFSGNAPNSHAAIAFSGRSEGVSDLLTSISNGVGGVTLINYTSSTSLNNTQLPFYVPVVSSINVCDNYDTTNSRCLTTLSTSSYTYLSGFFHIGERDFRGFNYAKTTGQAGPNGEQIISETWYHQGNEVDPISKSASKNDIFVHANVQTGYMKGKPYRTKLSDGQGNVVSEMTTSYSAGSGAAPYFNPPIQVDSTIFDGDPTGRQTRTIYSYDEYGNIVEENQYGDLGDPADDRTIVRTFSPNSSNWIVGLPVSDEIYQGIGTTNKIAGSTYYYDDLIACNGIPSNNQTPEKGNLTRTVKWLSDGSNPEIREAFDSYGNKICQRDPNGNITTVAYDSSNTFPTLISNPLGHPTTTQYYGVNGVLADIGLYGQVKSTTDANNAVTTSEYDVFGRNTKVTLPDNTWTSLSYINFGAVGSQYVRTDTSVGLWSLSYFDGLGRTFKKKSSGPDSKTIVSETQYDTRGAVKQVSYPYFEGLETPRYRTYHYDAAGRVTQETNPDSTRTLACYKNGITAKIDANNHRRREVRDVKGQLIKVQEYTGLFTTCTTDEGTPYAVTNYTFDVLGNLRYLSDTKTNQTEMRYDSLGHKIYMRDPDMGVWSYGYDGNGNLTSQTDAKLQTITFGYDVLNRPTTKHYPAGQDIIFTYDLATSSNSKGRLSMMTDAAGQMVYNYNNMGKVTSSARTIDGVSYPLSYSYLQGRLNSVTYPDTETVTYSYDSGGNLTSTGSYASYANYNALAQPGTLSFNNGVVTTYQYSPSNNHPQSIGTAKGAVSLLNLNYIYDNIGNLLSIKDANNNPLQSFAYDDLNRLSQAASPVYGANTYSYDEIGNILIKENVNYTYGGPRPHAVTSLSSGKTYSYDANGNIVSDGQRTISYNYDNMPTQVGTVNFVYDGNGARIKKYITSPTMIYIDKFYECISGACIKYIYAGDKRIASKASGQVLYYHSDHLGSTSVVTDSLGAKAEEISYWPFGKTALDSGLSVSHKYTGQESDSETGLYNYNARLYDPELGRFLTPDTIVPDPNNPQALNRYSYVINNPLVYTDPTGHSWWSKIWHGFLGAIRDIGVDANVSVNTSYSYGGSGSTSGSTNNGPTFTVNGGNNSPKSSGAFANNKPEHGMTIYSGGEWANANSLYSQFVNTYQGSYSGSSDGSIHLAITNQNSSEKNTNGLNSSDSFSLLSKVLTTGNTIAVVGIGLTTAGIMVPSTSAAAPFIAIGGAVTAVSGLGWSMYQYYKGDISLTQHTVNGGIASASLATSLIPAPAGPFLNVLVRSLDISNSSIGAFK